MINYILKYVVTVVIILELFQKNAAIKIRTFHDYLNFIEPSILKSISKYQINTNFCIIRKREKCNYLNLNDPVKGDCTIPTEEENANREQKYLEARNVNDEIQNVINGEEKGKEQNAVVGGEGNEQSSNEENDVHNERPHNIGNDSIPRNSSKGGGESGTGPSCETGNGIEKEKVKREYLDGEILTEEEINEHMKFQQWSDRLLLSKEESTYYYDIENNCVNTKYFDKINQVNSTFYKKESILKDCSVNLIPFQNKRESAEMCQSMTKDFTNGKLSYSMFQGGIKSTKGTDKTNPVNSQLLDSCQTSNSYSADKKEMNMEKEVILNNEEIEQLSDINLNKRTNIFFPTQSLFSSVYIGKDAFNDFLEKGLNSIKLCLNKYLHYYYEHNLKSNLEDKIFLMFILRYIKNYLLNIIYRTFHTKLINEVEIENDSIIYPNNKKLINNEVYLELEAEYEEIVNILEHFFDKIRDMFKINENELSDYLAKKSEIINYSTPYVLKSNEETEKHIKNMWTYFNFKIFNNALPNFNLINFYWINGKVEKLLNIPNMKTYKIVNKDFMNLPSILLCTALKTSPLLLNYTILKIMYEYNRLLQVNILPFKEIKNYNKSKKFDETKQKVIKYVHGIAGLLDNIDFYYYTPYLGDLNLTDKESAKFFSYIKDVIGNNSKMFYSLEYNKEFSTYNNKKEKETSFSSTPSMSTYGESYFHNRNVNAQTSFNNEEENEHVHDSGPVGGGSTSGEELQWENEVKKGGCVPSEGIAKREEAEAVAADELETSEEAEDEDDIVFLLLRSKVTSDINKAIQMATNVHKKKNVSNLWGHSYDVVDYSDPTSISPELRQNNEDRKESQEKKIIHGNLQDKNSNIKLQRFRIPLNEFAGSLFLCDVNNSTKHLTQGIEKLKELNEFDLTYVHNALVHCCLRFLNDSGNENEDVDAMLKKYEKSEKVETTNNIMTLQMMVVIGELFRNIRKMRTKEKYFFKRIMQTDVISDLYKDSSVYDENMNINKMDYVMKNLVIQYPLNKNMLLNKKNREEIAYYFLNYYTKYIFRFDLPNNIVIKFTDDISGLSFYDYNFDYITNDAVIYIHNDINSSLILSRIILDECLNIYEKYTTYIHKYGGNSDGSTIKEAKSKIKNYGEGNPSQRQEENAYKKKENCSKKRGDKNGSSLGIDTKPKIDEEEILENEDEQECTDTTQYEDYTEENIDPANVDLNNVKDLTGSTKSISESSSESSEESDSSDEAIDDENVDIFNYLKINKIKQFIRFLIEYNDWPFFLDETTNLESYLNSEELHMFKNVKHNNSLSNFFVTLKNGHISKQRIMNIIENIIKREDCKSVWTDKRIPIKHIAAALFTNNYINLFKVFQGGIKELLKLKLNELDFIMNKCKYACDIIYYKRLEEIKSSNNNLIFTMYNENLSSIEYYFDKLKEKIILMSLIKNKDIFGILINLISDIFPNKTKIPSEIEKELSVKSKDQINKLIFLYDKEKKKCGYTTSLNRTNVTYNLFHFFNKEIFNNKLNNVQIEFIKDDKILSTHANFVNTFENSRILINDNIFSINILSNVLLKEMAEIYYFYNDNKIERENKLYLKHNFKSSYLPVVFKYSKSFQGVKIMQPFDFNEREIYGKARESSINRDNPSNLNTVSNTSIASSSGGTKSDGFSSGSYASSEGPTSDMNKMSQREYFAAEKDKFDIENLISKIASYDHDEIFKEIIEFRKAKYNDNMEVQKCLEEYLYTYEKINTAKYFSPDGSNQSDEHKEKGEDKGEEIDMAEEKDIGNRKDTYNGKDMIKGNTMGEDKCSENEQDRKEKQSLDNELLFEPNDIKNIYLNYMYKYIEYVIKKKEFPITFNDVNEDWINCLTELENQKILMYSTKNNSGHLYELLINSNACSSKRALSILEQSLQKNKNNELTESTISCSEDNDALKNFDEFVLWMNKNKRKNIEKLDEQALLNDTTTSEDIKKDIKEVIDNYNTTHDPQGDKKLDPNNITIDNIKDLIKKHNVSKEDIQAAMSQLNMSDDFDVDSLFK
ncbi:hypothetical protein MKS88_003189 [Plasmodium brasilianum]|uniref:Uncharacterized protein n=2 Tax=Plasmodium (Plasmodium) TaxID=418103 RepID=A0A1A8W0G6_PLAMA|nr:conserved Plasmodium protein, unknown function [Plasmodium malariae]KAI4837773.1 hypothetical protein MKS88_003189 [Plasmodium brasilianum]SBS86255.1 hypothetical protein PMALA_015450 [Plasmodium malariae]SCN44772.1 conserved Plasmodium protein, unknown function [Plasmodium malariae]